MHFAHSTAWVPDKRVKMENNSRASCCIFFCAEGKMTENSVDKVYIRATDICSSLSFSPSLSVALSLSLSLSFFLLCVRSFFRVLAEMSWDRALLTLLSRTSPLRGRFTKEYLAHEELVPATGETSNEQRTRSWIMRCFQFHLHHRGIFVLHDSRKRSFLSAMAMLPIYAGLLFI